jgi:HEAT repeat protein
VRREVVAALEGITLQPEEAILRETVIAPLAVILAQDDDRLVLYYAARALGRLGRLVSAPDVRQVALDALETARLQSIHPQVQKVAANALAGWSDR